MQTPVSFTKRDKLLAQLRRDEANDWDLIVVGGGITGAGVLREAARRGYRALLLEQQDFAWGTSSRSSKMIHGGLRYLASGDLRLTRQALTERERLLREAPGLIERMGYYYVLRKGGFPGRWAMSLVLAIYDSIARIKDHRYVDNSKLLQEFPGLSDTGLTGACYYTDAVSDDARLVLRVLQEAIADGGEALNYVTVQNLLLEEDQVAGVSLTTDSDREPIRLRAPVVISATGAWADQLRGEVHTEKRIRPLRGSHLVLPKSRLPVNNVLAFQHPKDKRAVFIFPWEGTTVVGTTDLDHSDDLNIEAGITAEEVDYLLEMVHHQFPKLHICRDDVLSTWSGVRPVIGSEKSRDASKERRDHAVWVDKGLVTVSGGKLTTFRLIALDALKAAAARLPERDVVHDDTVFRSGDPSAGTGKHDNAVMLRARYGVNTASLLEDAEINECKCVEGTSYSLAECRWALRHEAVQHLDDLLLRRTRLGLITPNGGSKLLETLQVLCKNELGWNEERWIREVERYSKIWQQYYSLP